MDRRPQPTQINLHQVSRVLDVTFDDGASFSLPVEYLRVFSPSAEVRGHGPGQEVLQVGKREVNITAIEPVGVYAVKFVFSDGHDTHLLLGLPARARHQAGFELEVLPRTDRAGKGLARQMTDDKTTNFGYRQVPEGEKARRVGEVFESVAPSYDLMNDLMSLGLHRVWKRFALEMSGVRAGSRVLDVASGSGDLALAFASAPAPSGQVWMTDINAAMLGVGRDKAHRCGTSSRRWRSAMPRSIVLPATRSNACRWPFGLLQHDVTRKWRWPEMASVTRPGGEEVCCVLEFSKPCEAAHERLRRVLVPILPAPRGSTLPATRRVPLPRRIDPMLPTTGKPLKAMMDRAGS